MYAANRVSRFAAVAAALAILAILTLATTVPVAGADAIVRVSRPPQAVPMPVQPTPVPVVIVKRPEILWVLESLRSRIDVDWVTGWITGTIARAR